ncbi:MAG: ABC transporter substrate-binding protein [Chloroflexi bacterium]|nr:ABC transporter substrate-binding protein [Chloroflexota bacterium]
MDGNALSRRRILQTTLAGGSLAVTGLLAACGAPPSPTAAPKAAEPTKPAAAAPTTAPAAAATAPAKAAEPTKPAAPAAGAGLAPTATPLPEAAIGKGATVVNFWNGLTGQDGEGMQRLMEKYAQVNPEVTVKFQRIVWRTFYDKLSASLVAGNPPEMWIFHSEQVIRFASRGLMKGVDDLAKSGGIPIEDMGYTLPFARYEGKLYSVPLDQYTWCLLYNKDLVKQAGLDPEKPPTTLQEFQEWGRKLTIDNGGKKAGEPGFDPKNVKQWGYYYNLQGAMWQSMLAQQGVPPMITGPDAKDVNTDSPEAIKALEEMISWREKHMFAPDPTGVTPMDGFFAGKVAMTYNGVWVTNGLKARPQLQTGVAVTPKFFNNNKATFSGHQMAMPSSLDGKKLEEAWKTIKYISDNSLEWAKEGQTPARKSVLASKEFQELWPQSVFAKQLPEGIIIQPHLRLIELGDQIDPALGAALSGAKTPTEALKEAAQRQRQILARRD